MSDLLRLVAGLILVVFVHEVRAQVTAASLTSDLASRVSALCERGMSPSLDDARRYERCVESVVASDRLALAQAYSDANARLVQLDAYDEYVELIIGLAGDRVALSEQRLLNTMVSAAETDFAGLKWGAGVGYSFSTDKVISSAVEANGVLTTVTDKSDQARALLEFHNYMWCRGGSQGPKPDGCGLFVAASATSDDLLAGVGFGVMWGWRDKSDDRVGETPRSDGFSLGIGVLLDNDVTSLAEGFEIGQPLPVGETDPRYETKSRWSLLLFFTKTF